MDYDLDTETKFALYLDQQRRLARRRGLVRPMFEKIITFFAPPRKGLSAGV